MFFMASMNTRHWNFSTQVTKMDKLLLDHLLEMESSFFARNAKAEVAQLRSEIVDFILQSCHFLESIYDPHFRWRAFLIYNRKEAEAPEIPPTQVGLHQGQSSILLLIGFQTKYLDLCIH